MNRHSRRPMAGKTIPLTASSNGIPEGDRSPNSRRSCFPYL